MYAVIIDTVNKLEKLAQQADEKKAEFYNAGDKTSAMHYAGIRDGILRSITVVQQGL